MTVNKVKQYQYVSTGGGVGRTEWEIHKAGCSHVTRDLKRHAVNQVTQVQALSPESILNEELPYVTDLGYTKDDIRIMPCCKEAL